MASPPQGSRDADVVVVGAGLSGLVAAGQLATAGADVVVVDKGVGPGGRLATRRFAGARFDHGAQFFTVRSTTFGDLVDRWRDEGCSVTVWNHGFARSERIEDGPRAAEDAADGHPRHVVRGGMNDLAKHLARGLDVRTRTRVRGLRPDAGRWRLATDERASFTAARVVLTPPVAQTLALFADKDAWLPDDARTRLVAVDYAPCLAVLLRLATSPSMPAPGGVQFRSGPVRFLADNAAKGVSPVPAVTVHLAAEESRRWFDADDDVIAQRVGDLVRDWCAGAAVAAWQVKRWRYAEPTVGHGERTLRVAVDGAVATFAGDAFAEAKVEGAARSGLAAAAALIR